MNETLTQEQRLVAACDLAPGEILKVVAFAGTGKTSTLVAYATARPQMRFLYVAFNKSVQVEAADKFPSNVTAKTAHALAFRTHGVRHKDRIVPAFRAHQVMAALDLPRFEDARFTIDTLLQYLVSDAPKVSRRHVPLAAGVLYAQKGVPLPDFVALANQLGRLMCEGTDTRIGMLHDGYLKLYQLSRPRLDYDCILVDEGQDLNPVTSAIVLAQARRQEAGAPSVIIVGDSHQQIYSFRGARDTLKTLTGVKTLYLTRSFRFDNAIARGANLVLRFMKGEKRKILGTAVARGGKPAWNPRRFTIIGRTNAGIFDKAVQHYRTFKIGFVGGVDGYRLQQILDVYHLYAGAPEHVSEAAIRGFGDFCALKNYAARVEDIALLSLVKIVETYQRSVQWLVPEIRDRSVAAADAEILLTTAHKAKGLEWDNVHMLDDFKAFVENDALIDPARIDTDEINLVYVAMTRSRCKLRFEPGGSMARFIVLSQKALKKGSLS